MGFWLRRSVTMRDSPTHHPDPSTDQRGEQQQFPLPGDDECPHAIPPRHVNDGRWAEALHQLALLFIGEFADDVSEGKRRTPICGLLRLIGIEDPVADRAHAPDAGATARTHELETQIRRRLTPVPRHDGDGSVAEKAR